jgi:Family of unknown function (DUF6350)
VAVSSVVVLGSLVVHAGTAGDLLGRLGGGFVAAVLVAVLDLALVPNAVIATLSYVAGPGFAVGAGTSVTLGGSHLGAVPSLPLLAALPHGAAPLPVRALCLAGLVAAGVVAGRRVESQSPGSPRRAAAGGLGAGVAAGVLVALLAAVAGGPAGPGRMAVVGASPWQAGLAFAGEIGVAAAASAALIAWRRSARS